MIDRLPRAGFFDSGSGDDAARAGHRANRRRALVFGGVFAVATILGLVFDFSRPAVYEATALLNFVPSSPGSAAPDGAKAAGQPYALRDEIQYLTSTTLLETLVAGLAAPTASPSADGAPMSAATLQAMLSARQVPDTNVVSIQAHGSDPAFLASFVNRLVDAYRASLGERFRTGSTTSIAEAEDESTKLDAALVVKRRELDAFRAKNNIVSLERDENQVLSEVKGTGVALNAANEKLAGAEARLASLKEAAAAGQSVVRARDNPTLAALEQAAASIRADLRETARTFTQDYMAIDPRIRSQRARLAEIDEQIVQQRKSSQQSAMQEATQDVAAARAAAGTLRAQIAANQHTVQSFTSHFNDYRAQQEEVTHLEQLRQKAVDRLATLQAGEAGRRPKVEVVEPATRPRSPASPAYARDALIVVVASIAIALLAMGIVELFNRPPARPATVIVPQPFTTVDLAPMAPALPGGRVERLATRPSSFDEQTPAPRLAAPTVLPRELADAELTRLLATADPAIRGAITLLLCGVAPDEVVALRAGDVDREAGTLAVGGADRRTIGVPPELARSLPLDGASVEQPVVASEHGQALTGSDLSTALLYAAHDAGIDDADEVTPDALRHTLIAHLLRQGMRFADLARIVGPLAADRLTAYRALLPGSSTAADAIDRVLPALRRSASAAG